jgi:hypothetical protein
MWTPTDIFTMKRKWQRVDDISRRRIFCLFQVHSFHATSTLMLEKGINYEIRPYKLQNFNYIFLYKIRNVSFFV